MDSAEGDRRQSSRAARRSSGPSGPFLDAYVVDRSWPKRVFSTLSEVRRVSLSGDLPENQRFGFKHHLGEI